MALQSNLFDHPKTTPNEEHNPILFGHDPTERIVAVEAGERELILWQRLWDEKVVQITEPFTPWLLLTEPHPHLDIEPIELEGEGFRFLYEFSRWSAFTEARQYLRDEHVEHFAYPSAIKQALTRCGKTLFKGMTMADVVRMQIDIETEGLSPEPENNRILIIAVRDNRGLLEALTGEEPELIAHFVALLRERDPDILEGHNIYGFDLPFLMARAKRHNIPLAIGRDGSEARVGAIRNFAIGGTTRPFAPVYVYGRHVVDTFLAVQRFDWARGALTSYGLKEVARSLGIAEPERIEIPRDAMASIFQRDPERVLTYARQDVIETARLAEIVTPTEFYQAQMIPDSYSASAVTGSGEKINSLFARAYLAQNHAIPLPRPTHSYAGGYTDVRAVGVIDRIVKADVESLYPSIMLAHKIKPASDTLNVFLPALAELTQQRFVAKARARSTEGAERHYWDGLQGSFKVLINSFYGYLGAAGFNFNDPEAAGRITEIGRKLVQEIAARMEATGSRVIEIDTDGVYFVPPGHVQGEEAERAYVAEIGETLPEGIRLAFDGRYKAMISLKTKNYVLQGYDGVITLKGASLRSRADEEFGREFLEKAIELLLAHRPEEISRLYEQTIEDIRNNRIPIEKLCRRERVTEKTFTSANKMRSARIARNASIGDYVTVYERTNGELALLEDYTPGDENTPYYMEKLYKFACRLQEAIGERFHELIPKPTPQGLPGRMQRQLDLFG